MTIPVNATERYFPVALFIKLYKVTLSLRMKSDGVTTQMRATEKYVYFALFFFFFHDVM